MILKYFNTALFAICSLSAWAQKEEIKLVNPSFEDTPHAGLAPVGWGDAGAADQTPPDVQPNGGFSCTRPAYEGKTYVGLVTRDNDTYEGVTQQLAKPIKSGKCYSFSLMLCRSETYESLSVTTLGLENFSNPVLVRVWGGNSKGDRGQKLGETPLITSSEWKRFDFKLKPQADYRYITIEAYYRTPVLFPYNGNVLVDALSTIALLPDCGDAVADNGSKKSDGGKVNVGPGKKDPPVLPTVKETNPPKNPTKQETFTADLKVTDVQEGQTFRMDNLYFKTDSATITNVSYKQLDQLYAFLKNNKGVYVEVGGHTNGLPSDEYCDKLSSSRAQTVANYLIKKGISPARVRYKGYGKRQPIASNDTKAGQAKNQRVEIKILKVE